MVIPRPDTEEKRRFPLKNTLISQSSCYDCGPTCILNGFRFLFDREEIPPAVIRRIWTVCLDNYGDNGEPGTAGTSKAALQYLASWLNHYGEKKGFPVRAAFLELEQALIREGSRTWDCLEKGGCAVVRVWLDHTGHYVLLTRIAEDGRIGLFDPYAGQQDPGDPDRRFIPDEPFLRNREVRSEILNRTGTENYAMGEPERREILLLRRADR